LQQQQQQQQQLDEMYADGVRQVKGNARELKGKMINLLPMCLTFGVTRS